MSLFLQEDHNLGINSNITGEELIDTSLVDNISFLQVHAFYPEYLDNLLAVKCSTQMKYSEIMQVINQDSFGAIHMFAHHMKQHGYNGELIVFNCEYTQKLWAFENQVKFDPTNWMQDIVRHQINMMKPEILYIDPMSFNGDFFHKLSYQPKMIVGWRGAEVNENLDWNNFDIVFSHLDVCRKRAIELGAKKSEHLLPGVPRELYKLTEGVEQVYDVVFSGAYTVRHKKRNALLIQLAELAELPQFPLKLGFFIHDETGELPEVIKKYNQGPRFGREMYRALASGKIVINAEIDMAAGDAGNMRLFETTGIGSFMLTEHHPNISQYYRPGVEIDTFKDFNQMYEKIVHYLLHDEERKLVAKRGYVRAINDHSIDRRCKLLGSIFDNAIKEKEKKFIKKENMEELDTPWGAAPANQEALNLMKEALLALQEGRNNDAVKLFSECEIKTPNDPQNSVAKSVALIRLGRIGEAKETLNIVLQKYPHHISAKTLLSQIVEPNQRQEIDVLGEASRLISINDGVGALKLLDGALARKEHLSGLHFLRGKALNIVGRHEEALESYEIEVRVNPSNEVAKREVARLAASMRKSEIPYLNPLQRPYGSKLPRDVIRSIQGGVHNYQYKGVLMLKDPFDIALYPLLIWNLKPRTIFEIGSKNGGSALWYADQLRSMKIDGKVISIDIVKPKNIADDLVTFYEGDGRKLNETITSVMLSALPRPWLVIEDADHSYETSSAVLNFFDPHLRSGEYIVVEDGIISDMDNDDNFNSGPHKAIKEFLSLNHSRYDIDQNYSDLFGYNYTWCSNGWIKRK